MSEPQPQSKIAHDPWSVPRLMALGAVTLTAIFVFIYYISG